MRREERKKSRGEKRKEKSYERRRDKMNAQNAIESEGKESRR